ncbi:aminotransferase class I/II-fold pyridoxal phosphate-dependent enzyme [Kitasatospora sp. NPDC101235]|uniref:aminotransferase class I/II-fold pyridoxal phosphate-dependent enzyme n=1 Tax=Kitasatospora sp. NPDC101235 TaxID=3364101 RepID=UPI00380CF0D3
MTAQPPRPAIRSYNSDAPASADLLRLHLNETPYGGPAGAVAAARAELDERCSVYPESECAELRARIARHVGLAPANVAVGNGTDELVLLTALTFLGPDRAAVVTATSFPGYRTSAAVAGAPVTEVPLEAYHVPAAAVAAAIDERTGAAFVCNPLNPTGTVLDRGGVERIIAAAEAAGAVAVFDEAYLDFADPELGHALDAVRAGRPVVVLRTFSKAWGLAALRVGYAVGREDLIARLWQTRQALPFDVNRLAQRAAVAALDDPDFIASVRSRTQEARRRLYRGLDALGIRYIPSVTNFVLVEVGDDPGTVAARLADEHGILVRDLAVFGLPGRLRVTVGTPGQVDRFCAALAAVLEVTTGAGNGSGLAPHWEKAAPTFAPMEFPSLFNGYIGAQTAFALAELGVWTALDEGPRPVAELAVVADSTVPRTRALLNTMALLGYVELRDEMAFLTTAGRELIRHRGFLMWGVGGYGAMMSSLADLATGRAVYGRDVRRDEGRIAKGAGEVGSELMLPVEQRILEGLDYGDVADLGCGDGTRLIRLAGNRPEPRRGVGIDISEAACAIAEKRVVEAGLAGNLEIVCGDVLFGEERPVFPGIDLVGSFLLLHDLFAASDEPAGMVRALRRAFPDARYFLLADTNAQSWERHEGPLPAFSLEFELMHAFMDTPLLSRDAYEAAFAAGGLRVRRREQFGAPSTWIWLLEVEPAE